MRQTVLTFCAFLLFSGFALSQTQPAAWDSTYRPSSYPLLTRQFKYFKHHKSDFVFLGNSITFGTDWYELLELPQARNRGISGDMTFGVLERLQEIIDGKPAKLFIMIGVNDILRNVPDRYIIENYHKMLSRVRKGSPRIKIYVQSILPVNESFPQHKSVIGKGVRIVSMNRELQQIAVEYGATYIDLYSAFESPEGILDAGLTYDGLHLNLEGYLRWKETLQKGGYLK
ncbi:MAG: GDSL-type esterase/lipase family protein [Prolixibacteraceae bacterium]|jgi:lysophospholipase L1-like esterase|nr:GDSL-type esterase/lipase family protein [Prolixibacteraceae bacterium]